MNKVSALVLTAVLCVATLSVALPASADNYTGEYAWLRFWDAKVDWSDHYHHSWQGIGWLGNLWATGERWYELSWSEAMTLTGTKVESWAQFGPAGYINEYKLMYWNAGANEGQGKWEDIATSVPLVGGVNYNGSTPETTVRFLDPVTTTAIRVVFPEGSYDADAANKVGPGGGPGVTKFLPIGNLASGQGLDPSNPNFNLLATDWRTSADPFLGINPVVTLTGRGVSENGHIAGQLLTDNDINPDYPRTGWLSPLDGNETVICDLGASLLIHGVTLYGGMHYTYLPSTMDVYVTDNLEDWGKPVGQATFCDAGEYQNDTIYCTLTTLTDLNTVGQYVILANLTGGPHLLMHELAINATAIPEPVTMTLLTLGGLAMLRRRK